MLSATFHNSHAILAHSEDDIHPSSILTETPRRCVRYKASNERNQSPSLSSVGRGCAGSLYVTVCDLVNSVCAMKM